MTPFADRLALVERFGEVEIANLEDPDNTGLPNSELSQTALEDASEEINTYVAARYTLPLPINNIPTPLVRACCDVARFRLYKDRPTEEVKYRYERTIKWLEQLASGKAVLVFDPPLLPEQEPTTIAVAVGTTYYGGVFGKETTDKMIKLQ